MPRAVPGSGHAAVSGEVGGREIPILHSRYSQYIKCKNTSMMKKL